MLWLTRIACLCILSIIYLYVSCPVKLYYDADIRVVVFIAAVPTVCPL